MAARASIISLILLALLPWNEAFCLEDSDEENDLYFTNFERSCDPRYFSSNKLFSSVGYLLKLSVNGEEIKADTVAYDPEEPSKQLTVAALIEFVEWNSKSSDQNISMACKISPQFKSSLLEALCVSKVNPKIEVQWVIYEYDFNKRDYFRSFHTDGKTIPLIAKGEIRISDKPDFESQPVFVMYLPLIAKDKNQKVHFSFRADGKTFSLPIASD